MIGMRKYIGVAEALTKLSPDSKWAVRDNDYDKIEWHSDDIEMPTKEQVQNKILELEAEAPMNSLREIRNWLLEQCDWTQAQDIRSIRGEEWAAEWDNYRQQLRDITESGITPYYGDFDELLGFELPVKPRA